MTELSMSSSMSMCKGLILSNCSSDKKSSNNKKSSKVKKPTQVDTKKST